MDDHQLKQFSTTGGFASTSTSQDKGQKFFTDFVKICNKQRLSVSISKNVSLAKKMALKTAN